MNLNEMMDAAFKYKIGDLVLPRSYLAYFKLDSEINAPVERGRYMSRQFSSPVGEIVVERLMQQCHGGVQTFVMVRRVDKDGRSILAQYAELEVIPFEEVAAVIRTMSVEAKEKDK